MTMTVTQSHGTTGLASKPLRASNQSSSTLLAVSHHWGYLNGYTLADPPFTDPSYTHKHSHITGPNIKLKVTKYSNNSKPKQKVALNSLMMNSPTGVNVI